MESSSTTSLTALKSSGVTFSSDPKQDAARRVAFQELCVTVVDNGGEIVPKLVAQEREGDTLVHVNSLVFQVVGSSDVILVILQNSDTVDTSKVEALLSSTENKHPTALRLAPADLVEQVCGFPPGSVPPIGHSPSSLRTIVDEKLLNVDTVWGGGGHPEYACVMNVETLLEPTHVETADIALETVDMVHRNDQSKVNGLIVNGEQVPKPFFPVAPPPLEVAKECCDNPEAPLALMPEPVSIVGRITGVRQMARRLVFADLAPPTLNDKDDYPWKSGVDAKDMAVQLIAGKTLCEALGDVAGPAALRRIKRGQLLYVKGRTNVGNRDSLRNWLEKRSLDVIVSSFQILEESSLPIPPANVKRSSEQDKLRSGVATVPPAPPRQSSARPKSSSSLHLALSDVFPSVNGVSPVTIVDDITSVNEFAGKISQLLLSLTTSNNANVDTASEGDDSVPGIDKVGLIGMDCEWRPSFLAASPSEPQPVLLLQISIHPLKQVFLFDAQALFRPLQDAKEPMTELEAAASHTLVDLFSSQRLLKVGFQLGQDLRRLASSYPHIPAFRLFNAVAEVATLVKKVMQVKKERNSKYHTASLSRVTEFLLGKAIDKEQQVSDWSLRPLTQEQVEYAALDAAVSPVLFEKALLMAHAGILTKTPATSSSILQISRWEDDTAFTGAVQSWRFLLLDKNDPAVIRKLKAKRIVGDPYVVTQRWQTGAKPPMRPSVPASKSGDAPYTDVSGVFRMPSKLVRITAGKDAATLVDCIVGERVGRSKEKCIASLLTGEAALPNRAKIEFHQRSGYVEFADGVALFVNMPDKSYKRSYPNGWLEDGKFLTWYLRKNEWKDGTSSLAQKLIHSEQGDDELPCVPVLFVRMNKGIFLCCGRCRAIASSVEAPEDETVEGVSKVGDWGLIQLRLELLDREMLQESDDFEAMVQNWLGNADRVDDANTSTVTCTPGNAAVKMEKIQTIANLVLTGNVVGALSLAINQTNVPLEERSLQKGVDTLKQLLSKDTSGDAAEALKRLEQEGSKGSNV